jgi:hypothetical protein
MVDQLAGLDPAAVSEQGTTTSQRDGSVQAAQVSKVSAEGTYCGGARNVNR